MLKLFYFLKETSKPTQHPLNGGAGRNRTDDLLLAKQALSQLSYSPQEFCYAKHAEPAALSLKRERLNSSKTRLSSREMVTQTSASRTL